MLKILFILILILFLLFIYLNIKREEYLGYGNVYGIHLNPNPRCNSNNDCFPGYYYRSQKYLNMCEPEDKRLKREKKKLTDNCVRSLEGNMFVDIQE